MKAQKTHFLMLGNKLACNRPIDTFREPPPTELFNWSKVTCNNCRSHARALVRSIENANGYQQSNWPPNMENAK